MDGTVHHFESPAVLRLRQGHFKLHACLPKSVGNTDRSKTFLILSTDLTLITLCARSPTKGLAYFVSPGVALHGLLHAWHWKSISKASPQVDN